MGVLCHDVPQPFWFVCFSGSALTHFSFTMPSNAAIATPTGPMAVPKHGWNNAPVVPPWRVASSGSSGTSSEPNEIGDEHRDEPSADPTVIGDRPLGDGTIANVDLEESDADNDKVDDPKAAPADTSQASDNIASLEVAPADTPQASNANGSQIRIVVLDPVAVPQHLPAKEKRRTAMFRPRVGFQPN